MKQNHKTPRATPPDGEAAPSASDAKLLHAPSLWDALPPTEARDVAANMTDPPLDEDLATTAVVEYFDGVAPRTSASKAAEEAQFRRRILREHLQGYIAIDGLYSRYGVQAHVGRLPEGEIVDGLRWIAHCGDLVWELPLDTPYVRQKLEEAAAQHGVTTDDLTDELLQWTIIDVANHLLGGFAARVMHGLYTAANDCWRSPVFRLDLNAFLTLLGRKPETRVDKGTNLKREYHRSEARAELNDTLRSLESVYLICERRVRDVDGETLIRQIRRPLLRILETDYRASENPNGERRRPLYIALALGWYSGVRAPDGTPGRDYVRHERLQPGLGHAGHHRTEEALRRRLMLMARYRLDSRRQRDGDAPPDETITLVLTRQRALERAGITTENVTWQKKSLTAALDKLVASGLIESFTPIPKKPYEKFTIVLRAAALQGLEIAPEPESAAELDETADEPLETYATLVGAGAVPQWPPEAVPPVEGALASPVVATSGMPRLATTSALGPAALMLVQLLELVRGQISPTQFANLEDLTARWEVRPDEQRPPDQTEPLALILVTPHGARQTEMLSRRYLSEFIIAARRLKLRPPLRIAARDVL